MEGEIEEETGREKNGKNLTYDKGSHVFLVNAVDSKAFMKTYK